MPERVFISYSHDSDAHADRVLALSNRLRGSGIDCRIDQYESAPPEGWPLWMDAQAEEADFVLIVFTERYTQRAKEKKKSGVKFESVLILQDLYEAGMINEKFIPILFDASDEQHILKWLRPYSYYLVDSDEGYEDLRRRLFEDPEVVMPPLGVPVKKGPRPLASSLPTVPTATGRTVVAIAHLPAAVDHFVGRVEELKQLDAAWEDDGTNVISLVAFGGVGKSALVGEWLRRLGRDDWRGARYVFGHSFYSQGAGEDKQASADAFIDLALRFFGDDDPTAGSPWDKGERLARLVRTSKTLLVLDGMEPLQYGPSAGESGRIKDPALQALVKELAASNQGLCVISTREAVADIPAAPSIDLEELKPPAGAALLKALGVKGTPKELEDASQSVQGHGLALTLLGTYLRKALGGDVRRIGEVELPEADERQGGHARTLMEKYERWLGEGAELSILRLFGLFDRPAEAASLAAVRAAPAIAGLTDSLVDVSEEDWKWAVSSLREYGLVAKEAFENDKSLDAHPLVREHFAAQLAAKRPEATREGHRRLYEHLKKSAPELPDNLQEMMPLYHAVAHGCKAGLYKQAYDDIYRKRIRRENEHFQIRKLGAFGADLAMLSGFFEGAWTKVVSELTEEDTGILLNVAGAELRALGRLGEAAEPMRTSVRFYVEHEDIGNNWGQASLNAGNLSELYLTLGDVPAAARAAEQSMELADRSGDAFHRKTHRARLAHVLHQSARLEQSLMAFREAEAIQAEWDSQHPLLYTMSGFQYCDLLLEEESRVLGPSSFARPEADGPQVEATLRSCREVRRRAETALELVLQGSQNLLDISLNHLTLGRTYLLEDQVSRIAGREPEDDVLTQAEAHLNQSVSLLRQAGHQDELPRGLLVRAALWRVCGERERGRKGVAETEYFERAERDLGEVEQVAGRSGMLLFQIEAALERCRLALTRDDHAEARRKLDEAQALVKKTEKPYEPHVPDWDAWEPPEYVGVIGEGEIVGYHRRNDEIAALGVALRGRGG